MLDLGPSMDLFSATHLRSNGLDLLAFFLHIYLSIDSYRCSHWISHHFLYTILIFHLISYHRLSSLSIITSYTQFSFFVGFFYHHFTRYSYFITFLIFLISWHVPLILHVAFQMYGASLTTTRFKGTCTQYGYFIQFAPSP